MSYVPVCSVKFTLRPIRSHNPNIGTALLPRAPGARKGRIRISSETIRRRPYGIHELRKVIRAVYRQKAPSRASGQTA